MRIHLAGAEVVQYAEVIAATGHKYALASYFNIKSTSIDAIKNRVVAPLNKRGVQVIVDSGVFSMMFGVGKGKKYDLIQLSDYADQFIESVRGYGFNDFYLVEMDIHKILGMDAVFKLREKFEKTGLKIMYVWHLEEGLKGLEDLAKRYGYIGIGCPELRLLFKKQKNNYKEAVWDLLKRIQKASPDIPRVHLLGNTVAETMETHLAWSCDSTSWLSGVRYGSGAVFNGSKIVKAHIRSPTFEQVRDKFLAENPAFNEWVNGFKSQKAVIYYKNTYAQAMAYRLYQQWLDRRFQWQGDESKLKGRI